MTLVVGGCHLIVSENVNELQFDFV